MGTMKLCDLAALPFQRCYRVLLFVLQYNYTTVAFHNLSGMYKFNVQSKVYHMGVMWSNLGCFKSMYGPQANYTRVIEIELTVSYPYINTINLELSIFNYTIFDYTKVIHTSTKKKSTENV